MLPDNEASSLAFPGLFISPDDFITSELRDYERGGIALNDPSQGLDVRNWECFATVSGDIMVRIVGAGGAGTLVFSAPGVSELSFTFDRNMQPVVAFVQTGVTKLRWYDSVTSGFVITEYVGARSPRVCHDDKRYVADARADVIFGYILDEDLCYRQQRDRYEIERVLRSGIEPTVRLKNIGMNKNWRLQFELV